MVGGDGRLPRRRASGSASTCPAASPTCSPRRPASRPERHELPTPTDIPIELPDGYRDQLAASREPLAGASAAAPAGRSRSDSPRRAASCASGRALRDDVRVPETARAVAGRRVRDPRRARHPSHAAPRRGRRYAVRSALSPSRRRARRAGAARPRRASTPLGHPDLEPLIRPRSGRAPTAASAATTSSRFPYGPIRSGVFESIQFLIETAGEDVPRLETRPFFKHRGHRAALRGDGARARGRMLAERVAGIAAVAHAIAFCAGGRARRCGIEPPPRPQRWRARARRARAARQPPRRRAKLAEDAGARRRRSPLRHPQGGRACACAPRCAAAASAAASSCRAESPPPPAARPRRRCWPRTRRASSATSRATGALLLRHGLVHRPADRQRTARPGADRRATARRARSPARPAVSTDARFERPYGDYRRLGLRGRDRRATATRWRGSRSASARSRECAPPDPPGARPARARTARRRRSAPSVPAAERRRRSAGPRRRRESSSTGSSSTAGPRRPCADRLALAPQLAALRRRLPGRRSHRLLLHRAQLRPHRRRERIADAGVDRPRAPQGRSSRPATRARARARARGLPRPRRGARDERCRRGAGSSSARPARSGRAAARSRSTAAAASSAAPASRRARSASASEADYETAARARAGSSSGAGERDAEPLRAALGEQTGRCAARSTSATSTPAPTAPRSGRSRRSRTPTTTCSGSASTSPLSPRHADVLLVTGGVTAPMREPLLPRLRG